MWKPFMRFYSCEIYDGEFRTLLFFLNQYLGLIFDLLSSGSQGSVNLSSTERHCYKTGLMAPEKT